jgi:hypothetical protein
MKTSLSPGIVNVFRFAGLGILVLTLAACPDQPRDPVVDPATEPLVTDPVVTPTVDPTAPPPGGQVAQLEPVGVGTATGQIHVYPRQTSTEVWVVVQNGPPNESLGVRVHSGTCESPGPELARITEVRTDGMGQGSSRTDVGHAPNLIMDENHIVAVYAPGTQPERDPPLTCATIPQLGM